MALALAPHWTAVHIALSALWPTGLGILLFFYARVYRHPKAKRVDKAS